MSNVIAAFHLSSTTRCVYFLKMFHFFKLSAREHDKVRSVRREKSFRGLSGETCLEASGRRKIDHSWSIPKFNSCATETRETPRVNSRRNELLRWIHGRRQTELNSNIASGKGASARKSREILRNRSCSSYSALLSIPAYTRLCGGISATTRTYLFGGNSFFAGCIRAFFPSASRHASNFISHINTSNAA